MRIFYEITRLHDLLLLTKIEPSDGRNEINYDCIH